MAAADMGENRRIGKLACMLTWSVGLDIIQADAVCDKPLDACTDAEAVFDAN